MDIVKQKYANLCELMEGGSSFDIKRAQSLISDLKIHFLSNNFLTNAESKLPVEERVAFRTVLEYEAIISIRSRSLDDFKRTMMELQREYFGSPELPPSPRMPLLISVHLVHVLTEQSTAEFSLEFQHARHLIGENPLLDYVDELYQCVVDYSFSRLFQLELNPPDKLFTQFTSDLLSFARNDFADSVEKSYETLSIPELAKIMHLQTCEEAQNFAVKRNWEISDDGIIRFSKKSVTGAKITEKSMERFVDLAVQISSFA